MTICSAPLTYYTIQEQLVLFLNSSGSIDI